MNFTDAETSVSAAVLSSTVRSWPELKAGDKIPTSSFLKSCDVVVSCFGALGTLLLPVKNDVSGNINKLRKVYDENPDKFQYLEDMILCERKVQGNTSVDALLWLKRALHLMYAILESLVTDNEEKNEQSDISANYMTSYENTLQPYHNWAIKKSFTFCINRGMMPHRRELLLALPTSSGVPSDSSIDDLVKKMEPFLNGLKTNLSAVITFYHNEGLDTVASL